jgi:hypothetical protein
MIYDIEYPYDFMEENLYLLNRIHLIGSVTTLLLLISIIWRKQCELDWEKAKNLYSNLDNLYSSNKLPSLLIELLLNIVHPVWFLTGAKFSHYNEVIHITAQYSYNSIFSIIAVVRVYHTFRLVLLKSKYSTARAQRVCKLNGILANKVWALKCIIIEHQIMVVVAMLIAGVIIGGFCLRVFERPFRDPSVQDWFDDYGNAMWCIVITMTTVGFGDVFPITIFGRIIGTLACVWGILVIGLMMVAVQNMLFFDPGQGKSYILHERLKFKESFKKLAIGVLKSAFRFKVMSRKSVKENDPEVSKQRSKYKRSIIEFQKAKLQSDILYELNTPERRIESKINEMMEYTNGNYENAKNIYESLFEIKEKLTDSKENSGKSL